MSNKKTNITETRKKISKLNKERFKYILSLINEKPMVLGIPREVFRKCGKSNCRCTKGKKHGPYQSLSINKEGKRKVVMIKKDDVSTILKQAERYKHYQDTLAKIRAINKIIDQYLEEIKKELTVNYPKLG